MAETAQRKAPPRPITREGLGQFMANQIAKGTSLIETKTNIPPPVSLQAQRKFGADDIGKTNYSKLSAERLAAGDKPKEIKVVPGDSRYAESSRFMRNQFGAPMMTSGKELSANQSLAARAWAQIQQEGGRDMSRVPMRFGTADQANAVNIAHGHKGQSTAQLVKGGKDAVVQKGLPPLDLAAPKKENSTGREDLMGPDGHQAFNDRGDPQFRTLDKKNENPGTRAPAVKLYHVAELRIAERDERCRPEGGKNYALDKGKVVQVASKSGEPIFDSKGKAVMNRDSNGKPVQAKVGAVIHDDKGHASRVPVVAYANHRKDPQQALTAVKQMLDTMSVKNQKDAGEPIPVKENAKLTEARFSTDKNGKNPVVEVPTKFPNDAAQLTEYARAAAHVTQWADKNNPNHQNAREAAAMPHRKRPTSPQFAACEITAQYAALQTVTRTGQTYEPKSQAVNDQYRKHWVKQMSEPGGVDRFGDATSRATRVCDGKHPTTGQSQQYRKEREIQGWEISKQQNRAKAGPAKDQSKGRPVEPSVDMSALTGAPGSDSAYANPSTGSAGTGAGDAKPGGGKAAQSQTIGEGGKR